MRSMFCLLFLIMMSASYSATIQLLGFQIKPSSVDSRFIFICDKKINGRVSSEREPDRIIVDLPNASKHFVMDNLRLLNANVLSIKTEKTSDGLRFIFYVNDKVKWTISYLSSARHKNIFMQLNIVSINKKQKKLKSKVQLTEQALQNLFKHDVANVMLETVKKSKEKHLVLS